MVIAGGETSYPRCGEHDRNRPVTYDYISTESKTAIGTYRPDRAHPAASLSTLPVILLSKLLFHTAPWMVECIAMSDCD